MRLNRLLGLATACLLAPLALPSPAEEAPDEDGNTRVYLEAYGFFPLETHSKTTLDNNSTKETLDLSDVLDMLTDVFSGRWLLRKVGSACKQGWTISASAHPRRSRPGTARTRFRTTGTRDYRSGGLTPKERSSRSPTPSKPSLIWPCATAPERFKNHG